MWQERSPTKLTSIRALPPGRGGLTAYPKVPRPRGFGTDFATSAPRTAAGVNEYLYALSLRDHGAVSCASTLGEQRLSSMPFLACHCRLSPPRVLTVP